MSLELQNLDCNCNNCLYMIRDLDKSQTSELMHYEWQLSAFNTVNCAMYNKALQWLKKGYVPKHDGILVQIKKRKFQFNRNECLIQYGRCSKFDKDVSFIPNTLQLETQECFKNRKNEQ